MSSGGDLVANFRKFVFRENLLHPDDQLLLAVSGGLDSTALAYLLKEEGYRFSLVHCNFQLRGDESLGDEAFVRQLAQQLDVRYFSTRFKLDQEKNAGESTQMVARRLRYIYFKKIMDEYKFTVLVTAHHLEDSFETVLLNLIRGTGLPGLRGIGVRTDFMAVRPLLEATRRQIRDYAESRNITWREDASNAADDYERNRIRHHLLPLFLNRFGMSTEGLAATLSNLRSAERFYQRGLGLDANPALRRTGEGFTLDRRTAGLGYVDTVTLLRHHTAHMGFSPEDYRQILTAPGYLEISSRRFVARVSPASIEFRAEDTVPAVAQVIDRLPFELQLPDTTFRLELVAMPGTLDQPGTLFCRFSGFPLHLRPRQAGDRFQPLGMEGSKKVKDFLIDAKVAPWERKESRVLTDSQGKIMALLPHRIDEAFAVRAPGTKVVRIRWESTNSDLH